MPRRQTPESSLLKACTDLLSAEKIWHLRMNTGAVKYDRRFIRFGLPGTADILALWPSECKCGFSTIPLWIECKAPTGKQSLKQLIFQRSVEEANHTYLLIRDVDELRTWLREHGAIGGIR